MKLAEALLLRADLQKRVEALKSRILRNSVVQEGEEPSEDPNELLHQVDAVIDELERLILTINMTNFGVQTSTGRSLTAALAERDALIMKHSILTAAAASAVKPPERYGIKEIRWVKTVNVAGLQSAADDLARRIREVNAEVQETNWQADLAAS